MDDKLIKDTLASAKTIAMVGISSIKKEIPDNIKRKPSIIVMKYLQEFGYKVIPVNPFSEGKKILHLLFTRHSFYEAGRETKVPLFKALEKAMTEIVENQQTYLPEFYQKRIAGMNHQLFRPGYSNDEEWGSIKSLSSSVYF